MIYDKIASWYPSGDIAIWLVVQTQSKTLFEIELDDKVLGCSLADASDDLVPFFDLQINK